MTSECVDLARSAGAVLAFKLIRTARFLAADAAHQYRSCIGGATACFLGRLGGAALQPVRKSRLCCPSQRAGWPGEALPVLAQRYGYCDGKRLAAERRCSFTLAVGEAS